LAARFIEKIKCTRELIKTLCYRWHCPSSNSSVFHVIALFSTPRLRLIVIKEIMLAPHLPLGNLSAPFSSGWKFEPYVSFADRINLYLYFGEHIRAMSRVSPIERCSMSPMIESRFCLSFWVLVKCYSMFIICCVVIAQTIAKNVDDHIIILCANFQWITWKCFITKKIFQW